MLDDDAVADADAVDGIELMCGAFRKITKQSSYDTLVVNTSILHSSTKQKHWYKVYPKTTHDRDDMVTRVTLVENSQWGACLTLQGPGRKEDTLRYAHTLRVCVIPCTREETRQ